MNSATKGPSRQQGAQSYSLGEAGGNSPVILIIVIVIVIDELDMCHLDLDAECGCPPFPFRTTKSSRHFSPQSLPAISHHKGSPAKTVLHVEVRTINNNKRERRHTLQVVIRTT
jgi:hypothetical protein